MVTLAQLSLKALFLSYEELVKLREDADANVDTAKAKVAELRMSLKKLPKTKDKGDLMIWVGMLQMINKKVSALFMAVEDKIRAPSVNLPVLDGQLRVSMYQ
jgi:hypothetical protein